MSDPNVIVLRREPVDGGKLTNVIVSGLGFTEVTVTVPNPILDTAAMDGLILAVLKGQIATHDAVNTVV